MNLVQFSTDSKLPMASCCFMPYPYPTLQWNLFQHMGLKSCACFAINIFYYFVILICANWQGFIRQKVSLQFLKQEWSMFNHYSFLNFLFISQQTKPFNLIEKGSNFTLPYHDFVQHTHCIYIQNVCLWWFSQEKKYLNTVEGGRRGEGGEREREGGRGALSVCFYSFHAI